MDMINRLNPLAKRLKASGIRKFAALAKAKEGCIGLTLGEPDFNTPENIKEKVKESLDKNMTHYPENSGYLFLRESISKYEKEVNNLDYSPEEIVVTCGATQALYSTFYSVLEQGDEVIIPTPDFLLYDIHIEMCGASCVLLDTTKDAFQITREALEAVYSEKTKAIILNSPNNPSGCLYTKETLEVIHEFFKDKPVFIICDDVYRQLIFTDEYKAFADYQDMRDKIIVVQSFSKPYSMTGWRVGYIMADKSIITALGFAHQYMITSIPAFVQEACVEALNTDVSDMVETYRKRRDYVYNRLVDMGMEVYKPEGAFYAFPSVKQYGVTSEEFCEDLIDKVGLALIPGVFFGSEGYVRMTYCYSDEILKEAMDRLESYINMIKK